jgi:hypothetical protein
VRWSPDGARIAALAYASSEEWEEQTGLWEPDGRMFYFSSMHDFGLHPPPHAYDAVTGQITHGIGGGGLPTWSRDGKTMVRRTGGAERWFEELENVR